MFKGKEIILIHIIIGSVILIYVFYSLLQHNPLLYSVVSSLVIVSILAVFITLASHVFLPKIMTIKYLVPYVAFLTVSMFLFRFVMIRYFAYLNPELVITIYNETDGSYSTFNQSSGMQKFLLTATGTYLFFNIGFVFLKRIHEENSKFLESEVERKKAEFKLLKTQFSPHFLLNAINNLYSVSILQPNKTSTHIEKLASLLKYITYDQTKSQIKLKSEVQFIKDYIFFQLEKGENDYQVNLNISDLDPEMLIEPRVLIAFIENAFKHSYSPGILAKIDIELRTVENEIHFSIKNTLSSYLRNMEEDGYFGMGVESVRLILDLVYENANELKINQTNTSYEVGLKIKVTHD